MASLKVSGCTNLAAVPLWHGGVQLNARLLALAGVGGFPAEERLP